MQILSFIYIPILKLELKDYRMEDVYKVMKAKADKKGAFDNRIYLEYVDEEKRNIIEENELNKKFRNKL